MFRKIAVGIAALIAGILLSGCSDDGQELSKLERPDYGEEATVHNLIAVVDGEEYEVSIDVQPKIISDDRINECFELAFEQVYEQMLSDNSGYDNITSDLNFVESVSEYGMSVSYYSDNPDLINSFGIINREAAAEGGSDCVIRVRLSYNELIWEYEVTARIMPKEYSEAELFEKELQESVNRQNKDAEADYIELPQTVNGKSITYVTPGQSKFSFVLFIVLSGFSFWYYVKFIKPRKEKEKRENSLKADYSELVSKISLLMGAGMSGANAMIKIAKDYEGRKEKRYAYDRIVVLANRIKSGTPEADAYAMFGRETGLHSYMKLCNLLARNTKKGSEGFKSILKEETTEAFCERKALARHKGEEAGTKLLLPMGMMLVVVLVIIIVPAFMSF